MNKIIEWKENTLARKTNKKGAVSIETIIVSGLILALGVAIILNFNSTVRKGANDSNQAISTAVDNATGDMGSNNTPTPTPTPPEGD